MVQRAAVERGQMVHHTGPTRKKSAKTVGSHSDQIAVLAARPISVEADARHRTMTATKPARVATRRTGRLNLCSTRLISGVSVMSMPGKALVR